MGMGGAHVYHQRAFRGRDDTADSNEDAGWIAALNTDWTQATDTPFRCRFLVEKQAGFVQATTYMDLYYSHNGGTWTFLDNAIEATTTDSILHCIESTNVAGYVEGDDTTFLLGAAETLLANNNGIVESSALTPNTTWPAASPTTYQADHEWCLTLRSSLVSAGDTIALRVYTSDVSFELVAPGGYDFEPTITVPTPVNTGTIMKLQGATAAIMGSTLTIK